MPMVAVKMVPPCFAVRLFAKTPTAVADVKPNVNNTNTGSTAVAAAVAGRLEYEKKQANLTGGGDNGVMAVTILPAVHAISVYDDPASVVVPDSDQAPMPARKKAVKLVSWEGKPLRSRGVISRELYTAVSSGM